MSEVSLRRLRLEQLIGRLGEIADLEYQRRAWSGRDPNHRSSLAELVNTIFSDLDALNFCNTDAEPLGISEWDCYRLTSFLSKLHRLTRLFPPTASVEVVQSSQEWQEISRDSNSLVRALLAYVPGYSLDDYLGRHP